ncbi:hypothetical protein CSUB_C0038 [Candidatus Caldarchaeum subterraneum]|uniref:DUF559 domain-containing protein n=1 Tax=Caldiarchaeum subterraneum TaxID=311458 RepID=E6N3B0_CALS0|nr:hypothetical protein HGMM_F29E04C22 [Candidatus Caldarchaeum subterraneum]BAJ49903.1 hypothetical protein CSUB_C0038 [Candidatus Caldarchaeum subterraneum]
MPEGYRIDILITAAMIVVEMDELQNYQERVHAKNLEKFNVSKKRGYEAFMIQAVDVSRDTASIAEMIKDSYIRRMNSGQKACEHWLQ